MLLVTAVTSTLLFGRAETSPAAAKISPELRKAIDDAKAFVEKARGHKYKSEPPIQVLNTKEFVKAFKKANTDDPDYAKGRRDFAVQMHALGFVDPKADPNAVLDALLDSAVAGYYDTKKNVLVVRGGKVTPAVKVILVHELTHSLDAQYTNLNHPEFNKRKDDSGEAYSFVVEGIARMIENKYRATLTAAEAAQVSAEENGSIDIGKLQATLANPKYIRSVPFLLTSLLGPYELGKEFAADVFADGGPAGLDNLYANPPETTEQATSLRAYKSREPAKTVAVPPIPAGATLLEKGRIGLTSLNAILAGFSGGDIRIGAPAQGWGGDSYAEYNLNGVDCITIDMVMDTDKDREELAKAFRAKAQQLPKAKVSDEAGGVTRFNSCAA
jgi:hypothetical protein